MIAIAFPVMPEVPVVLVAAAPVLVVVIGAKGVYDPQIYLVQPSP